jgi:Glycosyltransferase (GlcNAc)
MYRMNATDAAGPTLARALAAGLYREEAYWMQIDGHSRCLWLALQCSIPSQTGMIHQTSRQLTSWTTKLPILAPEMGSNCLHTGPVLAPVGVCNTRQS